MSRRFTGNLDLKAVPICARVKSVILSLSLLIAAPRAPCLATEFQVRSADGTEIRGEFAANAPRPQVAVIFVPGSGIYDRDALLGKTKTPREFIFKDLASRIQARGVATVRADGRGVRYGAAADQYLDNQLLATRTTGTMSEDLAAVYDWSLAPDGLGARCIVFFAHSEGMLHIGRLADRGAPAPALIIGMGAAMQSPVHIMRWQAAERDAYSLELMDANRDGVIANDEVRANWRRTPSAVFENLELLLHPNGAWRAEDIAAVRAAQMAFYETLKAEDLAHADTDPWPNADLVVAAYQWRKHFFVDAQPAAASLARWKTPISLHYGDQDSQLNPADQIAAASAHLTAGTWRVQIHPGQGHTLGDHLLLGPINEAIADTIADEAAAVAESCGK